MKTIILVILLWCVAMVLKGFVGAWRKDMLRRKQCMQCGSYNVESGVTEENYRWINCTDCHHHYGMFGCMLTPVIKETPDGGD